MADSESYHPGKAASDTINEGAPEANFYLPRTTPTTGTTLSSDDWPQNKKIPKLFEPITIKGMEFKNRLVRNFSFSHLHFATSLLILFASVYSIFVSPMCQYSCEAEGDKTGAVTSESLALPPFTILL